MGGTLRFGINWLEFNLGERGNRWRQVVGRDEERRLSNWAVEMKGKLHRGGASACYGRWVGATVKLEIDDEGEPKRGKRWFGYFNLQC